MSSTRFERPIVLDLRAGWSRHAALVVWAVAVVYVVWSRIPIQLALGLAIWTAVQLVLGILRWRRGLPSAARWHPRSGWHVRVSRAGWRPVELRRAHCLGRGLQLLCWRSAGGDRWCRMVTPGAASCAAQRRLRVMIRLNRFADDG